MNTLLAMHSFCKVMEYSSFAQAARDLNLSSAQVSKHISALEDHLKVRLLNRTTRRVTATEAGQDYYLKCQQILNDIEVLEASVGQHSSQVQGILKVAAPMDFAVMYLMDPIARFQQVYPQVRIELHLSDERISLIDRGMDVAIRIGELADSSLIARRLAETRPSYYASPSYLRQHGTPTTLEEMASHQVMHYLPSSDDKPMLRGPGEERVRPLQPWHLACNNGRALCEAAALGAGIISKPNFLAAPYLRDGRLVELLPQLRRPTLGIYALYLHRALVPGKVTQFVEFLAEHFRDGGSWNRVQNSARD